MLTIFDLATSHYDLDIPKFNHLGELTSKLDKLDSDFNQEIINEIVLWKINRHTQIDESTFALINKIGKNDDSINIALTSEILTKLLCKAQKGVRLAMASTFLRFRNPNIYQILDPRVYRFIFGKELNLPASDINQQIIIYLQYLEKLRETCEQHNIEFRLADRILYEMDKIYNVDLNLK